MTPTEYDVEPGTCLTCGSFYCSCEVYPDMYDEERRISTREIKREKDPNESRKAS